MKLAKGNGSKGTSRGTAATADDRLQQSSVASRANIFIVGELQSDFAVLKDQLVERPACRFDAAKFIRQKARVASTNCARRYADVSSRAGF